MRMGELVFVTSNLDKLREAEEVLGVSLDHHALDLDEIQSLDLESVVRHKARSAWERLRRPVLVEDTSLELAGAAGFPGPLVRWLLVSVGPSGIARVAHAFADPRATVRCMACACDGGEEILGLGVVRGRIAEAPRGRKGFGWDSVFEPEGARGRTYAEMSRAEKNAISHRRRALESLKSALLGTAP
ncbi:MAG: non-canonical purine NTP pyrophosphatase [Acidobacteria bacterium]|nr:non-canonical purine NTP pyrophosphatase [Acidobacteriota bacterium]